MSNEQTKIDSLTAKIMDGLREEVQSLVKKIDVAKNTLDETEEASRRFALACGGIAFEAMIQGCLEAQGYGHVGGRVDRGDGQSAFFERYEERWVLTHVGRFKIRRAYYWDAANGCGSIPLDERWGLDEREPSPSLRLSIGMLSAEVPFVRGRRIMEQTSLVSLPEKRMQESGEMLGEKIKRDKLKAIETTEPLLRDPNIGCPSPPASERAGTLYVQMDGGRINTTTEGWREPKVATLYWGDDVVEESKDRRAILKKEYTAVLGDADELASHLWEAACRWEWWKAERVVVLGDGAPWIWNRAEDLFPDAIQILDLYHAKEHIWKVARLLYGGAGKQKDKRADNVIPLSAKDRRTRAWALDRSAELENGDIDAILSNLRKKRPQKSETREAIDDLIRYLDENRTRTKYHEYTAQGLTVGSGTIESGIKNVVNQRMKGSGMRWAVDRAENMIFLRAAYLSDVGPHYHLKTA